MATTADITFEQTEANAHSYEDLPDTEDLVSDEADDLVVALIARERLARSNSDALSLEESMREHGVDPSEFGL